MGSIEADLEAAIPVKWDQVSVACRGLGRGLGRGAWARWPCGLLRDNKNWGANRLNLLDFAKAS